ncbi:MAG: hypothetical protein SXV54_23155 [Chloroflexota bacterium]|nr:hypothetical protein [Chloroflexota bacterium]
MKQRTHIRPVLVYALIVAMLLPAVLSAQPVCAGGGIVLHPPFDGTYRVTAYFDHENPNYGDDNYI